MQVIKVMTDYECYPIWLTEPEIDNLDPRTLPISPELADQLLSWAAEYDATLNRADPAASGFPDARAEVRFHQRGLGLARRLARELPDDYTVTFFDWRDSKVHLVA